MFCLKVSMWLFGLWDPSGLPFIHSLFMPSFAFVLFFPHFCVFIHLCTVALYIPLWAIKKSSETEQWKCDIRVISLFNFEKGRKVTETADEINETLGEEITSGWWAWKSLKWFRGGNLGLEDHKPCGRTSVIDEWERST